jgi:proteasome lid subunit RPN8/RPN11
VPTLLIPDSIRAALVAHAREGAPEEVCGVLAGERGAEEQRVETVHRAANAAQKPRVRYEIDPREQLELLETVEAAGREVVGFYHSHPRGPAEPSETDVELATWPDRSYVVVALDGSDGVSVGSWRWTGEAFVQEEVRVNEG